VATGRPYAELNGPPDTRQANPQPSGGRHPLMCSRGSPFGVFVPALGAGVDIGHASLYVAGMGEGRRASAGR